MFNKSLQKCSDDNHRQAWLIGSLKPPEYLLNNVFTGSKSWNTHGWLPPSPRAKPGLGIISPDLDRRWAGSEPKPEMIKQLSVKNLVLSDAIDFGTFVLCVVLWHSKTMKKRLLSVILWKWSPILYVEVVKSVFQKAGMDSTHLGVPPITLGFSGGLWALSWPDKAGLWAWFGPHSTRLWPWSCMDLTSIWFDSGSSPDLAHQTRLRMHFWVSLSYKVSATV